MFDAVVLAGGAARRLGGVDKPGVEVAGQTMLERVLAGCEAARRRVVVGPRRSCPRDLPWCRDVLWCREDPPGGGPVAALVAGLARLDALPADALPADELVVVLAADMPFVAAAVPDLLAAAPGRDGALLVDENGWDQPLAAAYRRRVLLERLAGFGDGRGAAVRTVVYGLDLARVSGRPDAATDCDTWAEVARARHTARPERG